MEIITSGFEMRRVRGEKRLETEVELVNPVMASEFLREWFTFKAQEAEDRKHRGRHRR